MPDARDIHTLRVPPRTHEEERRRARRFVDRRATDVSDAQYLIDVLGLDPVEGETR